VGIPLADLLVHLRADLRAPGPAVPPAAPWPGHEAEPASPVGTPGDAPGRPSDTAPGSRTARRLAFGAWARVWASPTGYRLSAAAARRLGRLTPDAVIRRIPLASGWGEGRDIPMPAARSFRHRWAHRQEDGW
jgi:hypothetical protein